MLKHNLSISLLIVAFSFPTILIKGAEEQKREKKVGSCFIELPHKIDVNFLTSHQRELDFYGSYKIAHRTPAEIAVDVGNVNALLLSCPKIAFDRRKATMTIREAVHALHFKYPLLGSKASERRYTLLYSIVWIYYARKQIEIMGHKNKKGIGK